MPSFTATELTGQVVHAYGPHIVNPHIVQKVTTGSGDSLIATVVGILGEGVWQGVDLVTWKGSTLTENVDYHFHPGYLPNDPADSAHGGAQAADPWVQGGSNYSGSAYIVAKIPVESADEDDFTSLKVRAKCLLVMDYDANGNELGLVYTANPANVFLDIYINKRGNPKSRVDFPSWYAWKLFNAEQVTWTGGSIPARPLFATLTNTALGADSSVFKTAATNAWDAGAVTEAIIPNGVVGFFEFDAGAGTFAGGLVDATTSTFTNSNALRFGVQCNSATPTGSSGILSLNLNGTNTVFGSWTTGDRLRTAVELINGVPTFTLYKNGFAQDLSGFSVPAATGNYRGALAFFHQATDILRSTFSPINTGGTGSERTRDRFVAGLAFVNTTDTNAAMEAVLYVSCANFQDVDGKLHFLVPSSVAHPRPATFNFTESNIIEDTFTTYRLTRNQRLTHILGKIRDLDTQYLTEETIPANRDSLEDILNRRVDGGEVYLGTMTQAQAKCVLNYQLRMTSDFDLFCSFEGDGTTFSVAPGDIVTVTHSLMGWDHVKFLVIQAEDNESFSKADTRMFVLQAFDVDAYSDSDQQPISINVPYTVPNNLTPAPQAIEMVLEQESRWGLNDAFTTYINGTVIFAESAIAQRARIWIYKPTATAPVITSIVVSPEAPNFSIPVQTNGTYTLYAVTENGVGYRDPAVALPDGYTNDSINIAAPEITLGVPVAPVASFAVSSVEISWQRPVNAERITEYEVWLNITDLTNLNNRVYFGSDTRTTYQFGVGAPVSQSFWVRSVNRMGQTSPFVQVNSGTAVPIVQLSAPSNYTIGFNGLELIHSFTPLAPNVNVGVYQIATDSGFTNIVSTGKSGLQLIKLSALPAGRTWNFYLRAIDNLGNVGPTAVPATQPFSLPLFDAPTIAFDPNRTYPFNAILVITPPVTLSDRRQVLKTVVETANSPAFTTIVNTYTYDGVAETADISGRFSTQATIYARVYYVDRTNLAGTISGTASVTFAALAAGDIGAGAIGLTQLASSIAAPQIVATLPALPNAQYPSNGSLVFNQADGRLYRNKDNVWTAEVPTSALSGQVVAGQIAANAVIAGTIAAAAVSTNELAANAVTAAKMAADSITARSLVIGGFTDNVVMNPDFVQVTGTKADGWSEYNVAGYTTGTSGNNFVQMGFTQGITSKVISVEPGDVYAVRLQMSATGGSHSAAVLFRATKPSVDYIGNGLLGLPTSDAFATLFNGAVTTSRAAYEATFTVPAGMFWMSIAVVGNTSGHTLSVYEIVAKRQVGDAFIANLRASKITGETIGAGLLFADQIKQASYNPYQSGSTYSQFTTIDTTNAAGNISLTTATDTISKTANSGAWNAAIASPTFARIERGNGYAECVIASTVKAGMFGLTANYNGASYTGIDFAWYFDDTNTLSIYEGGTLMVAAIGPYVVGDRLRVSIENGFVRYYKNDVLYYTSPYSPTNTIRGFSYTTTGGFRAVFAAFTVGAAIKQMVLSQEGFGAGWKLNPLSGSQVFDVIPVWTSATGTLSVLNGGRTLSKLSGSASWDSKAASMQTIAAGDGYIEFIHSTTATNLLYTVGLVGTSLLAGSSYTDFDFAFLFNTDGSVYIYERGVNTTFPSMTYAQGDIFRVAIEGGTVKYRKNGAIVWTSTNQAFLSYPVAAKVAANSVGVSVTGFGFTAASSGAGEFNSGITVRGRPLDEIVRMVSTGLSSDGSYKGRDSDVFLTDKLSSVDWDTVHFTWEDARYWIELSAIINSLGSDSRTNADSLRYVIVRAYDKFGNNIQKTTAHYQAFTGQGSSFMGWYNRDYADPFWEAVWSFQFVNRFGQSQVAWVSFAPWTNDGTLRAGTFTNRGTTPPIWKDPQLCATKLVAVPASETSVNLTWVKPTNAAAAAAGVLAYYRLYDPQGYKGTTNGWQLFGVGTPITDNTILITGLTANKRYEFLVDTRPPSPTAEAGWLWSNVAFARTLSTPLAAPTFPAPTGINAQSTGMTTANLTWTANGSPSSTEISRRDVTNNGAWTVISSAYTGAQPFADTGLTSGVTYAYRLRNNYSGSFSSYSTEAQLTTDVPIPPSNTPSGLTAFATGYFTGTATWTTNGSGTNHRVEYVPDAGAGNFTGASAITGASSPTGISLLQSGVTYRVRVRAESPTISNWSNEALFTTNTYIEPDPVDGCVVFDTPITAMDDAQRQYTLRADEVKTGQYLVSIAKNGARVIGKVKRVFSAHTTRLFTIVTESNHILTCSPGHPIIVEYGGKIKKAFELQTNDSVLVYNQHSDTAIESRIASIEYVDVNTPVLIFEMENDEHTFVSGGIVSHNIRNKY